MSEYTFKTLDNGDVKVTRTYEVHDSLSESEIVTDQRLYREIDAYVYRVYLNGTTGQVCDGLSSRGSTLASSGDGDLENLLRAKMTRLPSPTPAEILALRQSAGLDQKQAALRVKAASYRTWQNWELGARQMPATALALWEAQDKICDLERRLERAEHLQDR